MPATPNEALIDVNVLIAAIFADHPAHDTARSFVDNLQRFYTTPTTQGGFLRFATRPCKDTCSRQFPPRLTMAQGIETLMELTRLAEHSFTLDGPGLSNILVLQ